MTQLRYEHMILLSWLEHLELHWPGSKRLQWLTSVTWCSLLSLSMHLLNLVYLIRYASYMLLDGMQQSCRCCGHACSDYV